MKVINKEYYANRLKAHIESKGGRLLSEYNNSHTKVHVECKKGHKWWATPNKLIHQGTWCPHCHINNLSKRIELHASRLEAHVESKGGKLLSEYQNTHTKVHVECKQGHNWWVIPDNLIKKGTWCPQCHLRDLSKSRESYGNRFKQLIESKGGKVLSEYKNAHTKVQVECERGHTWRARPNDILNGTWCRKCYSIDIRERSRKEIEAIIEGKDGKLLEIDFSEKKTKVHVECKEGHRWWTRKGNIKEGKWCKQCYLNQMEKQRREKIDELKALINSKGGKLLSEYVTVKTKVHVECKQGHKWWVTPDNLINGGTWCPQCHFEKLSELFTEYTISDLQEFAESKGGACLEEKYLGWGVKHEWQCSRGHTWKATPRNVFGRPSKKGTWCPFCAEDEIFERVCRGILEEMFQTEFPKSSPHWLNTDKIGKPGGRRHLDGCNMVLKIAFEWQGIQHYRYEPFFHKGDINNFFKQKEEDEFKRKRCKENNVILLEIGFIGEEKLRRLKFSEIEDYIRQELLKKGVKVPEREEKINWVKFISIHRKQDLILKLLTLKGNLSQAEIAAHLKFSNKSVRVHTRALKALNLIKSKKGKQNRVIYYLNKSQKEMVLEKIGNIPDEEINSQLKKIRPIENRILELLQKRSNLTIKQISDTLKYSTRTIGKYLKSLKVSGYIAFKRELGKARSHPKLWYIRSSEWSFLEMSDLLKNQK